MKDIALARGSLLNVMASAACILLKEQRIAPGAYFAQRGQFNRCTNRKNTNPYNWSRSSVTSMLKVREYLGDTVNFKTAKASYKAKRMATSKDEQLVFTGTHEAIVDPETFLTNLWS